MNRNLLAVLMGLLAVVFASAARANPDPTLGRFLQRDPNATGQIVMNDTTWFHGRAPVIGVPRVDIGAMYGDGMNLHEYLGSNPTNRGDPMGLSWDPFDEAFAIGGEHLWSGLLGINQALYRAKEGMRAARAYERAAFQWDEMIMDRDEAILFSMVIGPFFSSLCFEEGTPVVLADGTTQRIESIHLGTTVFSTSDPLSASAIVANAGADPDAYDRIDPVTWRTVELELEDSQRGHVHVALLRPFGWFQATGLRKDNEITLNLPELGLSGKAKVIAVGPCSEVQKPAPGTQVVTGVFTTERAEIVRLWLAGESKPIGATPNHPFYSEDRSAWVPASELRVDERVRTLSGARQVERVEQTATRVPVYNFEVHRTHTYYVSESQVWVHNPCNGSFPTSKPGWRVSKFEQKEWITQRVWDMQK